MKLSELLEHTAKEYLDDRTDMVDGEADELFSDRVLVRHFNAAQRILCRRAWVITDVGHAQAGIIVLVTDKPTYALHKSVLRVHYGILDGDDAPLLRASDSHLLGYRAVDMTHFDVNVLSSESTGRPRALATDAGFRLARVYPTPSSTENGTKITLKVARLPVCWLEEGKKDESPEVPEDWHEALCKYAAGRCLTSANVDAAYKVDGRRLLDEFNEDVKEARRDRERAEDSGNRPHFSSATAGG